MPSMKRKGTIPRTALGSFVAGAGALASIWPAAQPARYPHRSETEALRGDFVRIGTDMRRVIKRQNAQLKEIEE